MRPIEGYDNYAVTTSGEVWAYPRIDARGHRRSGQWIKLAIVSGGYIGVVLTKDGVKKSHLVHRLVAEAFIANPDRKPQVNHVNGIKTDNRVDNLEWVTRSENIKHSFLIGLKVATISKGESNGRAKLTNNDVMNIKSIKGVTNVKLAEDYGVSVSQISRIRRGKFWRHI
ncbi:HNH endonuclease signature motif containing protein [Pectobacterium zantedeschiae]|uniref:HNH endonuclease signature motif containing protein n=1 Tax=Pectobacterium zantedeschiae TaxID=2034769 RepID=UPI0032EF4C09